MKRMKMTKRHSKKVFAKKAGVKSKNKWSPMRGGFRI